MSEVRQDPQSVGVETIERTELPKMPDIAERRNQLTARLDELGKHKGKSQFDDVEWHLVQSELTYLDVLGVQRAYNAVEQLRSLQTGNPIRPLPWKVPEDPQQPANS